MTDFRKLGKGIAGALAQAKQLAAAEREANLQKFLEPSKTQMRMYHGTTATEGGKGQEAIRRIKPSKEGALGSGVYMTPKTAHASGYTGIPNDEAIEAMRGTPYYDKMADQFMADRAAGTLREGQEGGNMLPVYAQIKNPLIIGQSGRNIDPAAEALINLGMDEESAIKLVEKAFEEKGNIGKQIQSRAQAQGYDGIMQYRGDDLSEVVSFNPNAVKSAIGNQGTYDIYSPDLSKADGGRIVKGLMGALSAAKQMATAEREANLAKFLEPSKEKRLMYHGTGQDIKEFKPGSANSVFVSPSSENAEAFGYHSNLINTKNNVPSAENVMPLYVQVKNPFDYENPAHIEALREYAEANKHGPKSLGRRIDFIPKGNWEDIEAGNVQNALKELGHDSFYVKEDDMKNLGIYDPKKVKSAIGNRGTYDITDPDINKAKGGVLHMADAGKVTKGIVGALTKATEIARAEKALPKVDRLSMNYKDVTKRVPEVADALERLLKGEITKAEYNDVVNMYKPVTPYSFVPKPATSEEAIGALRGDAAKARYGKQEEYEPGSKVGLRLDIPAYTGKGVWVNSIHDEVGKKVAYGPTASVKNANLGISQNESKRIAQGGAKAPYAKIKGEWNPLSEEEAVAKAQEYLDHPEWRQIGMDPERHSYFYDRHTMEPITGAEEVIQIGPLVLGKNPKYGKIEDFDYATGGGVRHMAKAGRVGDIVEGGLSVINKAKEIAKARKAAAEGSKIEEVLASQTPPMTTPSGTGLPLMPRDQGMYTPREQKDLPRMPKVDAARAAGEKPKYTERMQDLLDSPTARKKVDKLINKGKDLNMTEWYGTEPLRQVAMDAGRSPEQFESLMAQLASASQRNPVDKQNQMGSYLYHLSESGQLPENSLLLTNKLKKALKEDPSLAEGRTLVELPTGYGSLAQGDIFNRAVMIGQGDIAGALPPNKKLGTFYENLLGNLQPVTVDVNAVRGPIIERGDPRWLTSKLVEKDETGKVINSYKPREMYDTGEMSMREAQQRPGFWEAAPSGSEYAGFEDLWQRGAKRHGVKPAEAQALGWYGSADVTALKTKPENYVDNLERLIKRTAEQTGQSPTKVMNDFVTGEGFLRKKGGAVEEPHWHKVFNRKMAEGGYAWVDQKHIPKVRSLKHLAGGGSSDSEPTYKEIIAAIPELAKEQANKEFNVLKKPEGAKDVGMAVLSHMPGLGLGGDLVSFVDTVQTLIPGLYEEKPTSVLESKTAPGAPYRDNREMKREPKFPLRNIIPSPTGEEFQEKFKEAGWQGENEAPVTETIASLFGPGMLTKASKIGPAIKGGLNALPKNLPVGMSIKVVGEMTPKEQALAKMREMRPEIKARSDLQKQYDAEMDNKYTRDMPTFEQWKAKQNAKKAHGGLTLMR